MYETSDIRKGLKVLIGGEPYTVVDFQHVKPGKGNQFTRTKLKNLIHGGNLERTFRSGERLEVANLEAYEVNFLYADQQGFHFMDQTSYEQTCLGQEEVGDKKNYLTEGLTVTLLFFNDKAVGLDLPKAVELVVADAPPNMKGDTVSGGSKPATMETGVVINVPFHINIGDRLKINTQTGEYVERVKK